MTVDKKHRIPSIRGALARFRLECAREIEALDRINKNMTDPDDAPKAEKSEDKPGGS